MTALLLFVAALLIVLNGFFVAGEFALVRSRRSRLEAIRRRAPAAPISRSAARRAQRVPLGLPVRHHAGLAGHRLPGRAGDRRPDRAALRRALSHGVAVAIAIAIAYMLDHRAAHHGRRAGPEDLRDRQGRGRGAARGAAARLVQRAACARSSSVLNASVERHPARARHGSRREFEEGGTPEELRVLIAAGLHRRPARSGRGRDAAGRLPPARAGGAPGHDADPGGRDRRPLRGRGDGAAPLRLVRATRGWW